MSRGVRLMLSACMAVGFLVFSYWVTNLRFPLSGEKALLTKWEALHEWLWPRERVAVDSVLFVNVTYDRESRPFRDEWGSPAGRKTITDRRKLLQLLQVLKERGDYKYVLLDVFFGTDVPLQECDGELFSLIASMRRIVIPCHSDEPLVDKRLQAKAGLADYLVTLSESDFVKYPYFAEHQKSMPVKMYEDVTGRHIRRHGIFYTDGWKLVRSSIVLTFDLRADATYADDGNQIWYNLGMDLLDDSIPELDAKGSQMLLSDADIVRGKYVIIGSFNGDDMHGTFMGEQSGAAINFNAYISLLHGHHIVSLTLTIVLFAVFFLLSYLTLSRLRLRDLLQHTNVAPKRGGARWLLRLLVLACTWIGYSLVLAVLCLITYNVLGEVYDIFVTSTMFTLCKKMIDIYDNKHQYLKLWHIGKRVLFWR